jgi:hypothetical protein
VTRTVSQLCRSAPQREIRRLDGSPCTPQSDPRRTCGYRYKVKFGYRGWLALHISTLLRARPAYASILSKLSIRTGRKKSRILGRIRREGTSTQVTCSRHERPEWQEPSPLTHDRIQEFPTAGRIPSNLKTVLCLSVCGTWGGLPHDVLRNRNDRLHGDANR